MEDTKKGWVYVLTHDFMPDVVKIGFTKDLQQRVKSLSGTNVPDDFSYFHTRFFEDCRKAEKTVHQILDKYRVTSGKEFFKVDTSLAMQIIDKVFLEEKLEKYDQILHHLEKKTEILENKVENLEQDKQDLEEKLENLEQKTVQQNKQIQTLEAVIDIRNYEFTFLFQEYVLKDLKESKILENKIKFLARIISSVFDITRFYADNSSIFQYELQVFQEKLFELKHRAENTIKETEQFLEKNPNGVLSQKIDELKAQIQEINENSKDVENNLF